MKTATRASKPTLRQRKAFDKLVENGGNASQAMMAAGYTPATSKNPDKFTESKGYKQLADELGLTDSFLTQALVDDIRDKPKNRKAELELGFKVKGLLKDNDGGGNKTLILMITGENAERYGITATTTPRKPEDNRA